MKIRASIGAILVFAAGLIWFGRDLHKLATSDGAGAVPAYRLGEKLAQTPTAPTTKTAYRELSWEDLLPPGWDPAAAFKGLDLGALRDSDQRAVDALAQVQALWNNAPLNEKHNKTRVRIPGFLVPIERRGMLIDQFLLVPYFGACIHTPPPPANQIIHVRSAQPVQGLAMDAVWVSGELQTGRVDTAVGLAGYRIKADLVEPYKRPQ
jgi:hypothetical protein